MRPKVVATAPPPNMDDIGNCLAFSLMHCLYPPFTNSYKKEMLDAIHGQILTHYLEGGPADGKPNQEHFFSPKLKKQYGFNSANLDHRYKDIIEAIRSLATGTYIFYDEEHAITVRVEMPPCDELILIMDSAHLNPIFKFKKTEAAVIPEEQTVSRRYKSKLSTDFQIIQITKIQATQPSPLKKRKGSHRDT